eukprot:m.23415 g.23415  ORF g.23415 m.23415 type:complete len:551 (+) comp5946_c0_seq1:247-1899(+)
MPLFGKKKKGKDGPATEQSASSARDGSDYMSPPSRDYMAPPARGTVAPPAAAPGQPQSSYPAATSYAAPPGHEQGQTTAAATGYAAPPSQAYARSAPVASGYATPPAQTRSAQNGGGHTATGGYPNRAIQLHHIQHAPTVQRPAPNQYSTGSRPVARPAPPPPKVTAAPGTSSTAVNHSHSHTGAVDRINPAYASMGLPSAPHPGAVDRINPAYASSGDLAPTKGGWNPSGHPPPAATAPMPPPRSAPPPESNEYVTPTQYVSPSAPPPDEHHYEYCDTKTLQSLRSSAPPPVSTQTRRANSHSSVGSGNSSGGYGRRTGTTARRSASLDPPRYEEVRTAEYATPREYAEVGAPKAAPYASPGQYTPPGQYCAPGSYNIPSASQRPTPGQYIAPAQYVSPTAPQQYAIPGQYATPGPYSGTGAYLVPGPAGYQAQGNAPGVQSDARYRVGPSAGAPRVYQEPVRMVSDGGTHVTDFSDTRPAAAQPNNRVRRSAGLHRPGLSVPRKLSDEDKTQLVEKGIYDGLQNDRYGGGEHYSGGDQYAPGAQWGDY